MEQRPIDMKRVVLVLGVVGSVLTALAVGLTDALKAEATAEVVVNGQNK